MERICIEIIETGERRKLERPIWVTRNRNGILATPHRVKAGGGKRRGDGLEPGAAGGFSRGEVHHPD